MNASNRPMARLGGRASSRAAIPSNTTDLGYPWSDGELLYAEDLNEAIAGCVQVEGGVVTGPITFSGPLTISGPFTLLNQPTSPDGLPPGGVWINGGVVCVVQ